MFNQITVQINPELATMSYEGNYPIHIAAIRNDLDMVELLLNHGADINVQDYRGRTVMDWAIYHKNEKLIALIKDKYMYY